MRRFIAATALAALLLGACAGPPGRVAGQPDSGVFRDSTLSMAAAQALVVNGPRSKPDVLAALGPATVLPFDSGFEVWVYRERVPRGSDAAPAELVLLFAPDGRLAKTRIRPVANSRSN